VISTVAVAAGPVPNDVRSQSSVPPVVGPTIAQLPRVVVKPMKVKLLGGVSMRRTELALSEPMLLTTIV